MQKKKKQLIRTKASKKNIGRCKLQKKLLNRLEIQGFKMRVITNMKKWFQTNNATATATVMLTVKATKITG